MFRKPFKEHLIEAMGGRCKKCGSKVRLEIDHIKPTSKGGEDVFSNLQLLCHNCYLMKTHHYSYSFWCESCNKMFEGFSYLDLGREGGKKEFLKKNNMSNDKLQSCCNVVAEYSAFMKQFQKKFREDFCKHKEEEDGLV